MAQTNILLESGTNELEIVEFHLDETDEDGKPYQGFYGVNVAKVLEIIRLPEKVVEMPQSGSPAILGAFNQRSHVIPLVDLSIWLGKNRADSVSPKVIVTEFNKVVTAFLVSGVTRIHRLSWEVVEPPNRYVAEFSNDTITGVVKLEGRIVFLLDLEKIVADLNPALGLKLDESIDWSSEVRYRAIVADDSGLVREMLKDLMQKAGFEVETYTNGRDAWERLLALKQSSEAEGRRVFDHVQVMVSDIEMPSMDGHNLTKRIKDDPMLKEVPVILFSSLITDKLRHKGETVGADDQISKPEVTHLAQRAKALIERHIKELKG